MGSRRFLLLLPFHLSTPAHLFSASPLSHLQISRFPEFHAPLLPACLCSRCRLRYPESPPASRSALREARTLPNGARPRIKQLCLLHGKRPHMLLSGCVSECEDFPAGPQRCCQMHNHCSFSTTPEQPHHLTARERTLMAATGGRGRDEPFHRQDGLTYTWEK
ncbi:Hypp5046 [Branchiostoma lanceolatum]|uniref:Hypp5046 protein n=1 Tax=Branchiostoma lanceolatum TaxID=7740 RepID=A0A8K0AFS0_BRALA|nr:Hypp5046 [Branchiostoma lanceolatum]